jgi:hypothetical protein
MNNQVEKQLTFTCSACSAIFKLLEIKHERSRENCLRDCSRQWQALLNKHYQEHIILYLAQEEAQKEANHD